MNRALSKPVAGTAALALASSGISPAAFAAPTKATTSTATIRRMNAVIAQDPSFRTGVKTEGGTAKLVNVTSKGLDFQFRTDQGGGGTIIIGPPIVVHPDTVKEWIGIAVKIAGILLGGGGGSGGGGGGSGSGGGGGATSGSGGCNININGNGNSVSIGSVCPK